MTLAVMGKGAGPLVGKIAIGVAEEDNLLSPDDCGTSVEPINFTEDNTPSKVGISFASPDIFTPVAEISFPVVSPRINS
jgi:hypothetical protein